jgi:hypothetical protein
MDHYRDTAFYLTLWHAILATIVAVLLIALNDLGLASSLLIAANLALLFALVLMVRAGHLTDRRIKRGQLWRTLAPQQRAAGEAGLRMARQALQHAYLHFARGAAAVAIVLSALAYGASAGAWASAGRKPVTVAAIDSGSDTHSWSVRWGEPEACSTKTAARFSVSCSRISPRLGF